LSIPWLSCVALSRLIRDSSRTRADAARRRTRWSGSLRGLSLRALVATLKGAHWFVRSRLLPLFTGARAFTRGGQPAAARTRRSRGVGFVMSYRSRAGRVGGLVRGGKRSSPGWRRVRLRLWRSRAAARATSGSNVRARGGRAGGRNRGCCLRASRCGARRRRARDGGDPPQATGVVDRR
jgi:hypothetical protein